MRNHRWTRGDWQIIKWLKSDRLNDISKFKIYDNLSEDDQLLLEYEMEELAKANSGMDEMSDYQAYRGG